MNRQKRTEKIKFIKFKIKLNKKRNFPELINN